MRGDRATGVEQLRGGGVAQAVRIDLHPHALPGGFHAAVDQVLARAAGCGTGRHGRWDPARAPPGRLASACTVVSVR